MATPQCHRSRHTSLVRHPVVFAAAAPTQIQAELKAAGDLSRAGAIDFMELDLSVLASVRNFTTAFRARGVPLHVLVANAGIGWAPYTTTVDGWESTLAVNHFGHVLLVTDLMDIVERSAPSRVVIVSSRAHTRVSGTHTLAPSPTPWFDIVDNAVRSSCPTRRAWHAWCGLSSGLGWLLCWVVGQG